jgi:hypothetical protein
MRPRLECSCNASVRGWTRQPLTGERCKPPTASPWRSWPRTWNTLRERTRPSRHRHGASLLSSPPPEVVWACLQDLCGVKMGTWLPYWGVGYIVNEGEEHEQRVVARRVSDVSPNRFEHLRHHWVDRVRMLGHIPAIHLATTSCSCPSLSFMINPTPQYGSRVPFVTPPRSGKQAQTKAGGGLDDNDAAWRCRDSLVRSLQIFKFRCQDLGQAVGCLHRSLVTAWRVNPRTEALQEPPGR